MHLDRETALKASASMYEDLSWRQSQILPRFLSTRQLLPEFCGFSGLLIGNVISEHQLILGKLIVCRLLPLQQLIILVKTIINLVFVLHKINLIIL